MVDVVYNVVKEFLGIMLLAIFEDVFIGEVLGEEFSIVELFISWVNVDVDIVVAIEVMGIELVVIED